jgi:hypothetical protein
MRELFQKDPITVNEDCISIYAKRGFDSRISTQKWSKHETTLQTMQRSSQRIELEQSGREEIEKTRTRLIVIIELMRVLINLISRRKSCILFAWPRTDQNKGRSQIQLPVRHSKQGRKRNRTTRGQSKRANGKRDKKWNKKNGTCSIHFASAVMVMGRSHESRMGIIAR